MNIAYFIVPVLVGLVVGVSVFVAQQANLTGHLISTNVQTKQDKEKAPQQDILENKAKCPVSCDDQNPCTIDWCNETSNYFCAHIPINGTSDGCWGTPTTCTTNICVSGKCTSILVKDCCGNSICEPSESCSSCPGDCLSCPTSIAPTVIEQTTQTPVAQSQSQTTLVSNQTNTTNQTSITTNTTPMPSTTSNQTTQTSSNHVIISEVQTGPNEFVELYNPTNADVNAAGWYLSYYSPNRDWNNTYRNWAFPNNTVLKTGKFFLINVFNTSSPDWTLLTLDGKPYSLGQISNNGSIALFPFDPNIKSTVAAKSGRIDALGWGSPVYIFEYSPASSPGDGKSLARNSLNADSDSNAQDFSISNSPSPKNSTN